MSNRKKDQVRKRQEKEREETKPDKIATVDFRLPAWAVPIAKSENHKYYKINKFRK